MQTITIQTNRKEELNDITNQINKIVEEQNIKSGIITIYTPHTTTALTINESYDPDVKEDIINHLSKLIPTHNNYKHAEGNSHAHIKSSIIGNSRTIIIDNNKLQLGTWEGITFCEFDGPRTRKLYIKIIKEK
jgi:secondary thiamine-phosphate synthase enzyme